jgi:hypothetical protein
VFSSLQTRAAAVRDKQQEGFERLERRVLCCDVRAAHRKLLNAVRQPFAAY